MENNSPHFHGHSPLAKIILWAANSFFVGFGIFIVYVLIEGIFSIFYNLESIPMRILFFTAIGGVANLIYYNLIKK